MILFLCILSLFLWAYLIQKAVPGIGLTRLAVFTLCGFFFLYTVVSAGFFWADRFQFIPVLLVCIGLEALVSAGLVFHAYGRMEKGTGTRSGFNALAKCLDIRVSCDVRRYLIPLVISLLALPFTWEKFELYSMGQDQGTYQVKALALMAYDTHNYMEMEEFTRLETPEARQSYLDFVYGQNNLYLPRVIEETDRDAANFDRIVGTIHGLPTYSALLALWGLLFGYPRMIGVQTLLYLCLIFLMYFLTENMSVGRKLSCLVTALAAFSPIVVWGSKSSLTELGLAVIFGVFLYFLTLGGRSAYLAGLPLVVFAFFHISIYVFMPVLVITLFVLYLLDGNRGWLISVLVTLWGYLLSAFWSFSIAPYYSYGNYSVLWKLTRNLIHENNIKAVIVALCVVLSVLALFLMSSGGKRLAAELRNKMGQDRLWGNLLCWGVRLGLMGSALFFLYKGVIRAEYLRYCQYLQISTYIYMTGLLLIPFLYGYLLLRPRVAWKNPGLSALSLLFFYCVIAYSMFMRLEVLFYYYYARYVTIFLPVVFLLAGILLEEADRRGKISLCVLGVALLSFLPYDLGLITQKDHTRCEWEVLGDICEDITCEDAFLVGPDEQQIVFIFPVKLLTGCDVYYVEENLREQAQWLLKQYRNVYYLDYDGELERKMEEDGSWQDAPLSVEKVYTNWNHLSHLDYFNITNPLTPIPLNYVEYRLKLSMHEISLTG